MNSETRQRVINKVIECKQIAKNHGCLLQPITILFTLKGNWAGYATYKEMTVNFNQYYLEHNLEHMINDTVPHEVAHLVAYNMYGAHVKTHGVEWQKIMWEWYGLTPNRTHRMGQSNTAKKKFKRYNAYCPNCSRQIFSGTIKLVNKILYKQDLYRGGGLQCQFCRENLFFKIEDFRLDN